MASRRELARRRRLPRRPALDHDGDLRHGHRDAHPRVLDRIHAQGREVLEVLHLHEPLRLLDVAPHPGQQPRADVRRLGGRGRLLLPLDLVLVHREGERRCGQEGVRHQPHRRLRVHARHVPHLQRGRLAQLPRHLGEGDDAGDGHRDGDRAALLRRRRGEVRPAAAVGVASRRDGGPDARLCAHPRGHDGHGRCVPALPARAGARSDGDRSERDRDRRNGHRAVGRDDRVRAARHQEGVGLLDRQPARLHGLRRRLRGLRRGDLPHDHPRVLQGPALPRRGLGDPRPRRRAGHAPHGCAPEGDADHRGRR